MSSPVRRVGSDLSNSICSAAASHGLQQQTMSGNSTNDDDVAKAKQRLSLLFSSIGTWRRSVDSGGDAGSADRRSSSSSSKRQVKGSSRRGGGGLDIAQLVKKYASMVEHLFASSFSNGRRGETGRRELRRRRHSFTTSARRRGAAAPSKRHDGRLFSAPASLRGSPVTSGSGHLSVKGSTSSEESTMEELHSAIQAAIAHCKNSIAVVAKQQASAAGDHADQRKC